VATTTPRTIDADPLRRSHRGPVFTSTDEGWDMARAAWNVAVDQRPELVARAACTDDVVAAVRFARDQGLAVRVQGTGHGACGDLRGALLIDTSAMRGVEIDAARRVARVEAGALWSDVTGPAAAHGLAGLCGSSGGVGVVGFTLGGGMGLLGRRHGFAANSVLAVELVSADGQLRRVDAESDPELFWALRGGGGNFGAVVALEFRLHPVAEVYAGNLFWPIEQAREVMLAYAAWTESTPDTVSSSVRLLRLPPIPVVPEPLRGRAFINVVAGVIGGAQEGSAAIAELRAIAPPYLDTFAAMPAAGLAEVAGDPLDPVPSMSGHALLEALPPEAIDALLAVAGPEAETPLLQVEMRQLGGALSTAAPDAGAVGGLEAGFALFAVGLPMAPGHAEAIAASLAGVREAVRPWTTARRYLNFTDDSVDAATLYAPPAHRRLAELRARLDPRGLFQPNHPIDPAS
jgi:FAD/FMN-containing dehydrogenase